MKIRFTMKVITVVLIANLMSGGFVSAKSGDVSDCPAVTAPPESFFEKVRERDRLAAREFYKKYIDVKGMPVVAAAQVADLALQRTYEIVTHMLAGRSRAEDRLPNTAAQIVTISSCTGRSEGPPGCRMRHG